nr:MAG TPA: hypothetical protein [Caudoviricetes sp.]
MVDKAIQVAVLRAHPVGSYFITESADNPHEILGGGGMAKIGRAIPARRKCVVLRWK